MSEFVKRIVNKVIGNNDDIKASENNDVEVEITVEDKRGSNSSSVAEYRNSQYRNRNGVETVDLEPNNYKIPNMEKADKIEKTNDDKFDGKIVIGVEHAIPTSVRQSIVPNITNYESYFKNDKWDKTTKQYQLSREWGDKGQKSSRGIATIDDKYLVAVTERFGNIGDDIDVVLEDGTNIHCKIADIKDPKDSNYTDYGHKLDTVGGGSMVDVIEWEATVPQDKLEISDWFGKRVDKIITYKNDSNQ